jgi:hypothetical protein
MTREQRIEELQARREYLFNGMQGKFWLELHKILYGQLLNRRNALFSLSIRGLDSAFEAASLQAEVAMLQFVMNLPAILLKDTEEDIKSMLARDQEHGHEQET